GYGERARGDRGRAIREILYPRVRVAMVIGSDRADDDRQRALQRGDGGTLPPRRTELPVARTVLGRHHVVVDEDDLALHRAVRCGTERIDTFEIDDFTRNTCW